MLTRVLTLPSCCTTSGLGVRHAAAAPGPKLDRRAIRHLDAGWALGWGRSLLLDEAAAAA